MSSGRLCDGVEVHERQTLVRDEDLHAEVVRLLDHRQADRGVLEREAVTVRAPRRVHLERGDLAGACGGFHLVEPCVEVAEVRRDHVVHEDTRRAAVGELRGELLGAELIGERKRRVGRAGVRDVGEHRDRRVAREEEVVQVRGAVRALELVRRAARRDHAEHELHGLGRVLGPRSVGHHVVRVHVDDELAVAAERVLARLDLVRGRNRERATRAETSSTSAPSTSAVDGGDACRADELHAARSIVASTAATPPAVCRNRRRSMPTARAAVVGARERARASTSRSCRVGGSGTYSPLVAGVTPSGRRTSPSGSSSRRRGTRPRYEVATEPGRDGGIAVVLPATGRCRSDRGGKSRPPSYRPAPERRTHGVLAGFIR